jgi:glucose-1-phosphate cytidylyltransferase
MRLRDHAQSVPKPLVEIGSRPIVWHVVRLYAAQGFGRFLLLTGHRSELIERYVADETWPPGVEIECVFTGEETPTGGRLALTGDALGGGTFCVTYADGVADIDLRAQLDWHRSHGGLATMTVVRPRLAFGVAELVDRERIAGFQEKPLLDQWVNGGFFCFEPGVLDHMDDDSVLERAPLERLAEAGELYGWRHGGFWRCMDTYKDVLELDDLWVRGEAAWRNWE